MKKEQVLIVEDDADIRDGVRILLESEGYAVMEAEDGRQGLYCLNDEVDLVILDVMMPGMSGLRTCEEIRKISNVPILFLTAKAQESDKLIGLMAGGDDYLAKPFSYAELFWTEQYIREGGINNIWLFVPFGTGLYRFLRGKGVLLIPFMMSVMIEASQYVTGLGIAEFDDVFGNTIGGWIGMLIAYTALNSRNENV